MPDEELTSCDIIPRPEIAVLVDGNYPFTSQLMRNPLPEQWNCALEPMTVVVDMGHLLITAAKEKSTHAFTAYSDTVNH